MNIISMLISFEPTIVSKEGTKLQDLIVDRISRIFIHVYMYSFYFPLFTNTELSKVLKTYMFIRIIYTIKLEELGL